MVKIVNENVRKNERDAIKKNIPHNIIHYLKKTDTWAEQRKCKNYLE